MAKFREIPCKYYICNGECKKNREAEYKHYCQVCSLYTPRSHAKVKNLKREKLEVLSNEERTEIHI